MVINPHIYQLIILITSLSKNSCTQDLNFSLKLRHVFCAQGTSVGVLPWCASLSLLSPASSIVCACSVSSGCGNGGGRRARMTEEVTLFPGFYHRSTHSSSQLFSVPSLTHSGFPFFLLRIVYHIF